MANSRGFFANLASRGNDAVLAPFIVFPELGLSAINATVGATAKVAAVAARAAGSTGLVPFAELAEEFSNRVADRTLTAAQDAAALAVAGARKAIGQDSGRTANALLASTVLEKGASTAALPLLVAGDGLAAALAFEPSRQAAIGLGMLVSRALDTVSAQGVIPGNLQADTAARSRFGFYDMTTNGPVEAVARDARGVLGGLLALALGDLDWLAEGLKGFQVSAEYVYEKVEHGEVGPHTDIPISVSLGHYGTTIVEKYPNAFVRALESGDLLGVMRACLAEPEKVTTLFALYPTFTFKVLYDVTVFMGKALLDGPDAQKYALCELAIMESPLTNDDKDAALVDLRKTAPRTIIEYEYYVPLLVPFDGTAQDKAYRRNAAGEVIENRTVVPSVFKQIGMDIAQSLCSEVISLRSFLWLYGEEQVAREKNDRETARKYGPAVAQRIAAQPRYPLRPEEVAALTHGGPRPPAEVGSILDGLLRERGLREIADRIRVEPSSLAVEASA
jgi:hypothetical protein